MMLLKKSLFVVSFDVNIMKILFYLNLFHNKLRFDAEYIYRNKLLPNQVFINYTFPPSTPQCVMDNGPARLVSYAQKIQEGMTRRDRQFIQRKSLHSVEDLIS